MRVIAGSARGARLKVPAGDAVRPTGDRERERLFAVIEPWLREADCLDLFAGSGALGIEALSRGARSCVFVERARRACEAVRTNLERTGLSGRAELLAASASSALARLGARGRRFDVVFLDPPYDRPELLVGALETLDTLGLVAPDGLVAAEHRRGGLELPAGWEAGRSLESGASAILLCRPREVADDPC